MTHTVKQNPQKTALSEKFSSDKLTAMLYTTHPVNYVSYIQHPNATRHIFEFIAAWCYSESKKKTRQNPQIVYDLANAIVAEEDAPTTALSLLWNTRLLMEDPWHQKIVNHPSSTVNFLLHLYLNPDSYDLQPATANAIREMLLEADKDLILSGLHKKPEWKRYLLERMDLTVENPKSVPLEWVEKMFTEICSDDKEIVRLVTISDQPPF